MNAKQKEQIKNEAIEMLKKYLKPGDTVHGIIRNVSKSGMSRTIDFYGPEYVYLTGYMALAMDDKRDKHGALKVSGCGMDMVFATVYNLGSTLWPKGTPKSHSTRNGKPDNSGGYALKSSIL